MAGTWVPLVRLEELIGGEAAHALARAYGGQSLYVARRWHRAKSLLELIGPEATQALSTAFGGGDILLPRALVQPEAKKVRLARLLEAGLTPAEAARQVGCTLRHAQKVRSDLRI